MVVNLFSGLTFRNYTESTQNRAVFFCENFTLYLYSLQHSSIFFNCYMISWQFMYLFVYLNIILKIFRIRNANCNTRWQISTSWIFLKTYIGYSSIFSRVPSNVNKGSKFYIFLKTLRCPPCTYLYFLYFFLIGIGAPCL